MNKLLRNQEYTLQTMCSYYVLMITVVVGGKKRRKIGNKGENVRKKKLFHVHILQKYFQKAGFIRPYIKSIIMQFSEDWAKTYIPSPPINSSPPPLLLDNMFISLYLYCL